MLAIDDGCNSPNDRNNVLPAALSAPSRTEIEVARKRLKPLVERTPLVPLGLVGGPDNVYLKLENLQRFGSFKVRAAFNAIGALGPAALHNGIVTASAGNFGQGLAAAAQELEIACTVLVPETAAETKVRALRELGAQTLQVPFGQWWQALVTHRVAGQAGQFIHPVANPDVVAGNATLGLEILEDLPSVDTVLLPVGGGGLAAGVGSALQLHKPNVRVLAAETEAAGQVGAALDAGKPVEVDYQESFIDGAGGRTVLAELWPLLRSVLSGAVQVSVSDVRVAIRRLARERAIVAEGAGATPVAAALAAHTDSTVPAALGAQVVCVVSGGNIDPRVLADILTETAA